MATPHREPARQSKSQPASKRLHAKQAKPKSAHIHTQRVAARQSKPTRDAKK